MQGTIFDIQKFSIHDGPGIRTTVFFKGCPLRCRWCHNPESVSPGPLLAFLPARCIGCGYCFKHCPHGVHRMAQDRHELDRGACEVCGACTRECYAGALELVGRAATVDEVLQEVMKDKPFYDHSGGGITLSGGEPLYQPDFAVALLQAARQAGLHTCVETCGFAAPAVAARIRPLVDLFLYDVKETDPALHQEFTGVPLAPILDNLRALHAAGAAIRLRLPIVPGSNDRPDHFDRVAALCRELPQLQGVELMPYHALGESKMGRFGLPSARRVQSKAPEKADMDGWMTELQRRGVKVMSG